MPTPSNLADNVIDLAGADAFEQLGAPFRSTATASSSIINPAEVASRLLKRKVNLDDRDRVLLPASQAGIKKRPDAGYARGLNEPLKRISLCPSRPLVVRFTGIIVARKLGTL